MMENYVPFGPEWEKEMMKWNKKQLINQLRTEWVKDNDSQEELSAWRGKFQKLRYANVVDGIVEG